MRKTGMARLLELAGTKKHFIIPATILSALASIASFIPFIAIYWIIRDILSALPDMNSLDSSRLIGFGWLICVKKRWVS